MELERLSYKVSAEVRFTKREVDYMIDRAKRHYDHSCQMFGCAIGELGATTNGVLAQLRLFPAKRDDAACAFSFRELDTMLKILEMREFGIDSGKRENLRTTLFTKINHTCNVINARYEQLTKEESRCQKL